MEDKIKLLIEYQEVKIDICEHNYRIGEGDIWNEYVVYHRKFIELLQENQDIEKALGKIPKKGKQRIQGTIDYVASSTSKELKAEFKRYWGPENQAAKQRQLSGW